MSKKHTNTCYDCIHLATCYKIEHFGRDLETNIPCKEFIGINDRIEIVRCKECIYVDNGYIGHLNCRFFNSMPVSGMDYCKWGKQKASTSEKEVAVKHGHWIEEYDCDYITPHCSECGETALTKEETNYDYVYSSYCPRCGAKLGGEGE